MRRRVLLLLALWGLLALAACGAVSPTPTLIWRVAAPPQSSTATATAPPLATPTPARATPTTPAGAAPLPSPTPRAATATPSPTRHPSPVSGRAQWAEIARWQGDTIHITEAFIVRGPWRICWRLPSATEQFTVMIGDTRAGTWALLNGPAGATAGSIDQAPGGTYQLMLHNTTPYTVVVQDTPPGGIPTGARTQPCP